MKKIIALTLACVMLLLSLTSCALNPFAAIQKIFGFDFGGSINASPDDEPCETLDTGVVEAPADTFAPAEPEAEEPYECVPDMYLRVIYDGEVYYENISPISSGQPTILYFWGTWEPLSPSGLLDIENLPQVIAGEVQAIAVHTDMASDSAPEYVEGYFPDSNIIFAIDNEGEEYYEALGGIGYPYMVLIDDKGNIYETIEGTVSYDELMEIVNCLWS